LLLRNAAPAGGQLSDRRRRQAIPGTQRGQLRDHRSRVRRGCRSVPLAAHSCPGPSTRSGANSTASPSLMPLPQSPSSSPSLRAIPCRQLQPPSSFHSEPVSPGSFLSCLPALFFL